ncbi:MAG: ISAs1 family transposase [candidate division WOR-3 bacterium]
MCEVPVATIIEGFKDLQDPRVNRRKRHQLLDIIVIAICAVICGANDWVAVQRFGQSKLSWLKGFLELPNGIPSHDTFGRFFARLLPQPFEACFRRWTQAVTEVTRGQVLPVDGKELRRSHDRASGKEAIHMVSVWAATNRLVLGQRKVEEGSNEISVVPELLSLLDVSGCIVTADALNCQKENAQKIVEQEGDYVLAVKENQKKLYCDLVSLFEEAQKVHYRHVEHDYYKTVDKGHGRIETRQCWVISEPDYLDYLRDLGWPGLRTIVMVVGGRRIGEECTVKTRYFISSLECDAREALRAVRGYWSIENSLHWVLDIAFREDESRVRKDHGAENLAVLRHIALSLLSREKSAKVGIQNKRLMASWDEKYLLKVLMN